MHAHVHIVLLAGRHNGFEEIFHVFAQLFLVYSLIEVEELAEFLDGCLVFLAEVAADEALGLDDDILYQLVVLLRRHGLGQLVAFGQHVAALTPALWELELGPLLARALALENIDVEVGKLGVVEIEVSGAVGIVVEQVGTGPVEYGHKVVADAVDTLGSEVAEALLIHLDLVVTIGTAVLDCLNNGQ